MEVNVIAFGRIADITASPSWKMQGIKSTRELREQLEAQYPALQGMSYQIAVDKKITLNDTALSDQNEVALLPPFAGG